MAELTILTPFFNGHEAIKRLLPTIPASIPVIVIDDCSDNHYRVSERNEQVIYLEQKGFFSGAVNAGMRACNGDVLILNQDTHFTGDGWLDFIDQNRSRFGLLGERIGGNHPAWPHGYIHGTFMFIRRDVIDKIGYLNSRDYPLWGATCEYQLRAARAGYEAKHVRFVPDFHHDRGGQPYGSGIMTMLKRQPANKPLFLRTPPEVSIIIPCYNHGRFLRDAINSLIGGPTSLGEFPPQTFQSFEVIIVDDCSTDDTYQIGIALANESQGIRYIRRATNGGTPAANNTGIQMAHGRYITILCADDMFEPERLETLYLAAQNDPSKIYYDDVRLFSDGKRGQIWQMPEYDFEALLNKNFMHASIFFLRDAWEKIGGYPEIMRQGREDWAINIRFGINGYCGQHVSKTGLLYRRHEKNRTLENTSPKWRDHFLQQLKSLYPDVFKGVRPMACCGGQNVKRSPTRTNQAAVIPLSNGAVLIEYIGTSIGSQTFYGPITGARYAAGKARNIIPVDPRDLQTGSSRRPGLLEMIDDRKTLFRLYKVEPPKEERKPERVPALKESLPPDDETVYIKTPPTDEQPAIKKPATKRATKRAARKTPAKRNPRKGTAKDDSL